MPLRRSEPAACVRPITLESITRAQFACNSRTRCAPHFPCACRLQSERVITQKKRYRRQASTRVHTQAAPQNAALASRCCCCSMHIYSSMCARTCELNVYYSDRRRADTTTRCTALEVVQFEQIVAAREPQSCAPDCSTSRLLRRIPRLDRTPAIRQLNGNRSKT